ncbi:MAG TPA: hypothetical protein VM140_08400 [Burkholderiales bacterium]|nr:hypothetical protein [Burkholderiales bacterium]
MHPWRAGARVALALGYPIAIYFALVWFEPRWVAAAVVALILLRWRGRALGMFAGLSWLSHAVIAGSLALSLGALLANDETLLRLYPAGISIALLALFAISLRTPPPMVERIARLSHPDLPAEAVRYTRHVTEVWCAFFAVNAAISVWSALAASREVWALYNGFVVYLAMGTLFAGEWLLRRHLFPHAR